MKKILISLGLVLTLSFGATFNEGYSFYKKGDYKSALIILEDLALKDDENSQRLLGMIYYYGQGVEKNYLKAKKF